MRWDSVRNLKVGIAILMGLAPAEAAANTLYLVSSTKRGNSFILV
jgi:hypothetical protein